MWLLGQFTDYKNTRWNWPFRKNSIISYLNSLLMASSLLLKGSLYFGFTASCWSFRIWFSIQATFLCLLLGGAAAPATPGVRVGVEIPPLGLGAVCNKFGVLLSFSFGCRIVPAPIGRGRLCCAWKKKKICVKNKLKEPSKYDIFSYKLLICFTVLFFEKRTRAKQCQKVFFICGKKWTVW